MNPSWTSSTASSCTLSSEQNNKGGQNREKQVHHVKTTGGNTKTLILSTTVGSVQWSGMVDIWSRCECVRRFIGELVMREHRQRQEDEAFGDA